MNLPPFILHLAGAIASRGVFLRSLFAAHFKVVIAGTACHAERRKMTFLYTKTVLLANSHVRLGGLRAVLECDDFFMGLAIEEAEKGYLLAEVPVGAVVVGADGEILSRAHNKPVISIDPTAHAEILAIRSASLMVGNYRLPGSVVYVTLEPCAMCVGAMLHARVRRLVFGARDPRSGAAGSVLDLTRIDCFNHRIDVTAGVAAESCARVLRRFFKERRGREDRFKQ